MDYESIIFTGHAAGRMFERSVGVGDVESVVRSGEVIAEYPDDSPYPSLLLLGFAGGRPLHVVVAMDTASGTCYVVSVYEPYPELWGEGFRKRRPR